MIHIPSPKWSSPVCVFQTSHKKYNPIHLFAGNIGYVRAAVSLTVVVKLIPVSGMLT